MKKQILCICLWVSAIKPMAQEATAVYVNPAKPSDVILELPPTPPEEKEKKHKKNKKKLVHFSNAPVQNIPVRPPSSKVKVALIAATASVLSSITTALITYKASKCS